MSAGPEWGPLARLAGIWEGEKGGDVAYSNEKGEIALTPYREHTEFKPFGPVENGVQSLYGLDYRMAAWRGSEENPFHTEVGYWLWDAATGEIVKAFVIPRGITTLAGGTAEAEATEFTLKAAMGSQQYGVGENQYLAVNASTLSYEVTITIGTDSWSYQEATMLRMKEFDHPLAHTDHNTLHRVPG